MGIELALHYVFHQETDDAQILGNRCLVLRFHNMKNQFWAVGFGLGWTVKKRVLVDYEQLLTPVLLSFYGQKLIQFKKKNILSPN